MMILSFQNGPFSENDTIVHFQGGNTGDGSDPANQLRLVSSLSSPFIYHQRFFDIPGGDRQISEASTVLGLEFQKMMGRKEIT